MFGLNSPTFLATGTLAIIFMRTTAIPIILILIALGCNTRNNKMKLNSSLKDTIIINDLMEKRITEISEKYYPIKRISLKYLKTGSIQEGADLMIYNQKWVAPLSYGIRIFGMTPVDYIEKYEKDNKISIPTIYKEFLLEVNGCFIFDFDLFGLTPSMYEKGTLDRSKVQCFDLSTANKNWIYEYNINEELFHFGGRAYSYDENIGYFIDKKGIIKSIRNNGEVLREWFNFTEFLNEEINIVEKDMIESLPEDEKKKL